MAKCAVHQLVKSAAAPSGGMPPQSRIIGILPITLDTPMNRKFMPDADHSTWTPLETLTRLARRAHGQQEQHQPRERKKKDKIEKPERQNDGMFFLEVLSTFFLSVL